jgi:dolichol-phosphate mannosyltransferase
LKKILNRLQPRDKASVHTLVALATYNELDNLPLLVEAIRTQLPAADLLVVDDNSPDGTGEWCRQFAVENGWFHCFEREGKQGLGTAAHLSIRTAIDWQYRRLVTMDADWSHDPGFLPGLVAAAEKADVVVGSRYATGGKIEGWPWHRRIVSRLLNKLSRTLLQLPVRDASGAFRVYRVDKLAEIPLIELKASGYSYLEELLWYLCRTGATFAEVPIIFHDRRAGHSKAGLGEAWGKLTTVARLAVRR